MVEEMKEVEMIVEKVQVDVGSLWKGLYNLEAQIDTLTCETRTCEAVANSYAKKTETVKELEEGSEKEIGEIKYMLSRCEKEVQELHWSKNVIVRL